jgi:signal transduction histidine kinase
VENRRLFAESERRIREIDALYQADERLHRSLRLEDVLGAVVDVAVDILRADKSLVVVAEPAAGRLRVAAHRGYAAQTIANANAALDRLPPVGFGNRRRPLVVEDAANHPDSIKQVTEPEGIMSFIDVPITIGGQVFGVFDVAFTRRQRFTAEDERLYTALAQRAGVAIENARLYERSQRAASLEERQRLARELHDSVSQALYGISLGARTARTQLDRDPARAAEPLDYVLSLAEAGLAELRSLIFELRPESLETEGLVAAFGKQVEALRARHALEVTAEFDGEPALSLEAKEALYRIGQEALNNTVKHARATHITVRLESGPDGVRLSVTDNGVGFDPDGSFPGHMGLQSMKERAQAFGGEVRITSTPGSGTTVDITLPRRSGRQTVTPMP